MCPLFHNLVSLWKKNCQRNSSNNQAVLPTTDTDGFLSSQFWINSCLRLPRHEVLKQWAWHLSEVSWRFVCWKDDHALWFPPEPVCGAPCLLLLLSSPPPPLLLLLSSFTSPPSPLLLLLLLLLFLLILLLLLYSSSPPSPPPPPLPPPHPVLSSSLILLLLHLLLLLPIDSSVTSDSPSSWNTQDDSPTTQ